MTTMAAKLGKAGAVETVTLKKGRETTTISVPRLADTIRSARGLTIEMKSLEPALKEYRDYIASVAKDYIDASGTLTFIIDGIRCKVTFGYECVIPEEHVAEVRRLLGERFDDLVRTKITHSGTSKLIDMAADGDRGKAIAGCLVIKEKTPGVSFEDELNKQR
ncbi:MAG: hypothetical protein AB1553_00440 [Nitrospirota bacterium]